MMSKFGLKAHDSLDIMLDSFIRRRIQLTARQQMLLEPVQPGRPRASVVRDLGKQRESRLSNTGTRFTILPTPKSQRDYTLA